jgi:MerR family mercuric resistance operon transcriptional regulator
MAGDLTIGRVAKLAGVNVETIRYYQRRGLVPEPAKPFRGHRRYSMEMVTRIRFIKRAQALGFILEEIEGLLRLNEAGTCAKTRDLAARKVTLIRRKLADLSAMQAVLSDMIERCDAGNGQEECPIIRALVQE